MNEIKGPTLMPYIEKSSLNWFFKASWNTGDRLPNRPLITRVFSVQSLSTRIAEGTLSRVCFQSGWEGSTTTPNRGNCAELADVTNATTKSPSVSVAARTTHGRRLTADKSANGKAASTISPGRGMASEIRIVMARLDVGVSIDFRLLVQKLECPSPTS